MSHETTYTQLVADIQAWLEDDDSEFTGSIDQVITLGELRIYRDVDLSIWSTEAPTATAIGNELVVKPTPTEAIVSWQTVWYDIGTERTYLELRSTDWIRDHQTVGSTASPLFYSEINEIQWCVSPIPDAVLTINARGISRPEGLSATTATTWLGDNVPDLLLKACLAEAEGFLKADDRKPMWMEDYTALLPTVKRELYELLQQHYNLTPLEVPAVPTTQR